MNWSALIATAIGASALGVQLWLGSRQFEGKRFSRIIVAFWSFAVVVQLALAAYWIRYQYVSWKNDALSSFLLPPHRSISYFVNYVEGRFVGPLVVAFAASLVLMYLASFLNKRFEERFFEKEEPLLFGLGVFLAGYPGLIFYLPLVLILGVILSIAYQIKGKGRAPLYFLWLPASLLAILITYALLPELFVAQFNF